MKGAFITIEGIDGSGKDTLAQRIAEYLEKEGIDVIITREPGDALGGNVRKILMKEKPLPLSEMFLFMADRHEHVEKVIRPALEDGKWIISVRYIDSSVAYQGARGVDRELIERLNNEAVGNIYPDLTILLDLPVEEAMRRIEDRGDVVEHFEKEEFLRKVRGIYLEDASVHKDRIVIVDATQSPSEIFNQILPYIQDLIRRYRPATIDLKRKDMTDIILKGIEKGMHSFLLHGPWGCGHRHLIRNVIFRIIPNASDIDEDDNTYGITSPDLLVISGEKRGDIKIDDIRSVGEFLDYRPVEGDYRVVVIDDASFMTLQAGNALLKILEEPPSWGIFILFTSYPERMLSTVMSRCVRLRLDRFPVSGVASYFVETRGISYEEALLLARMCEGCPERIDHVENVLKASSVLDLISGYFYEYNKSDVSVVEDPVLWDKLVYEVAEQVLKKENMEPDILLQIIEWEGMLANNVQKKLISDLVYWKVREGMKGAHIS